jgi:hypothetical protein
VRGEIITCEAVAEILPRLADSSATASPGISRHVQTCLRCQAEAAQYRKLLRALRQLRTQVLEPTPGLVSDVLAAIDEAAEQRAIRAFLSGRRVAYVGGIAAATAAAGAAGAIVLANRARRRVALAG